MEDHTDGEDDIQEILGKASGNDGIFKDYQERTRRITYFFQKNELDCCVGKCFVGEESYHFCDPITKEQLLRHTRWEERPYILLFLRMSNGLYTCFKNRHRRSISLHVRLEPDGDNQRAVIIDCCYCDERGKRAGQKYTPHGLVTISFDYSLDNLLEIVNRELEGGFSGIITADDFQFPDLDRPFCGRI